MDADLLHIQGVQAYRQGRAADAVRLLQEAATAAPTRADIAFNFGLALQRHGDPAGAASRFAAAARLRPDWPEAHYNLGNAWRDAGDTEAAARSFRQALRLRPGYVQAEVNLANILKAQGKLEQAIAGYRRVLARNADLAEPHNNLGTALAEAGDRPAAEAAFRAALRVRPEFSAAMANLAGLMLVEASEARRTEARALFRAAADMLRGEMAGDTVPLESRLVMAECLQGVTEFAAAAQVLQDAVAAFPDAWRPRLELVEALRAAGRFDAAAAALPATVPAAAELQLLLIRGVLWRDMQRLDQAEADFRAALRLAPRHAVARTQLAQVLLAAGRLTEGFAHFEARTALFRPAVPPGPAWDGRAPAGRHILVVAEEGLGDTIQFARFVPLLAAAGARVTMTVPPPLVRLFGGLAEGVVVHHTGATIPAFDAWALVMGLPRLLGVGDPATLGAPYLRADPALVAAWRAWLPATGVRVGVAWAGNRSYAVDHLRSIAPAQLAPLLAVPGVHWVSLQPGAADDAVPGARLLSPWDRITDMADTAALVETLDLVITVDTAMAHLAGALGRPVWLLNRFNSDWRWQTGGAHSIWYHSLRQFRQVRAGDWSAPVAAAAAELAASAAA